MMQDNRMDCGWISKLYFLPAFVLILWKQKSVLLIFAAIVSCRFWYSSGIDWRYPDVIWRQLKSEVLSGYFFFCPSVVNQELAWPSEREGEIMETIQPALLWCLQSRALLFTRGFQSRHTCLCPWRHLLARRASRLKRRPNRHTTHTSEITGVCSHSLVKWNRILLNRSIWVW